jgi:phosphoribosylglycinamide formyltransferase-1
MNEELLPIRIAIFASGQGTNAREIIRYFHEQGHLVAGRRVEISLIVCNKPGAGVLKVAEESGISVLLIEKEKFRGSHYRKNLKIQIFLYRAGRIFMKIPSELIREYPDRILNIHPALPPHGGKQGMECCTRSRGGCPRGKAVSAFIMWTRSMIMEEFFQASFNLRQTNN